MKQRAWLVFISALTLIVLSPAPGADFDGDGTGELAVFRESSGLWAIRGVTRIYFGEVGDIPVPGHYDFSGPAAAAIFRPSSGLWAVRGITRVYFGGIDDLPRDGDYDGDGKRDIAIFRGNTGLWAVRGITRSYFGQAGDEVIGPGLPPLPTRNIDSSTVSQPGGSYQPFNLALEDTDLIAGNVKSGIAIYGIAGTVIEAAGNAVSADVLAGKTFSRNGAGGMIGTMPNRGSAGFIPTDSDIPIDPGYYDGTGSVSGDADLVSSNIRTGITIFGVTGDSDVVNTGSGDAAAADIKAGKTAWADGQEITGIIPTLSFSDQTSAVDEGFYPGADLAVVDTDLASGNIRGGTEIFGIPGDPTVVDTFGATAEPGDLRRDRTAWISGSEIIGTGCGEILVTGQDFSTQSGDDGHYRTGISFSYQTRSVNGDTITYDNVTGLSWASDGSAKGCNFGNMTDWSAAVHWAESLDFAGYDDWRLPNAKELYSIVSYAYQPIGPTCSWTYFPNTSMGYYWTSTVQPGLNTQAYHVDFQMGMIYPTPKTTTTVRVRAVREGL